MDKEQVILNSIKNSELTDSGISKEIQYILNKTGGLTLARNYKYILNEKFLGMKGDNELVVYLDEEHGIFRYGTSEGGIEGLEIKEKVDAYTLFEKAIDANAQVYGRVMEVRLTYHFESGFMVFIPNLEELSKKERKYLFKDYMKFTKMLFNGLIYDIEEKGVDGSTPARQMYGRDFSHELKSFNVPLWTEDKENDIFFDEKVEIIHGISHSLDKPNLPYHRFEEIENLVHAEYPVPYKPARVNQNKVTRFNLLVWNFIPYSTLERIGIKQIDELVDRYVTE